MKKKKKKKKKNYLDWITYFNINTFVVTKAELQFRQLRLATALEKFHYYEGVCILYTDVAKKFVL